MPNQLRRRATIADEGQSVSDEPPGRKLAETEEFQDLAFIAGDTQEHI